MKKWILSCLILIAATQLVVMAANVYLANSNVIRIGAEDMKFNNDIYTIDEKIYVPIRELSEKIRIPILWDGGKNQVELLTDFKTVHTSEKTQLKEDGIIPDEETAHEIGKVILEKYAGEAMEYETDERIYFLIVKFQEQYNSWRVTQTYKFKDENKGWGSSGIYVPEVILNRNTGEVISINTYSEIKEKTQVDGSIE